MFPNDSVVIGLDVGTSGARGVACGGNGELVAQATAEFPSNVAQVLGQVEQRPEDWWQAVLDLLSQLARQTKDRQVAAMAVVSTSGTLVCTDANGTPLRPAMMYSDSRATEQAQQINRIANPVIDRLGYRFNASFGLAKTCWVRDHESEVFRAARFFLAPADWLVGKLTGQWGLADETNALKAGYDLIECRWPDYFAELSVPTDRMPRVLPTGSVVGPILHEVAERTGLATSVQVALGSTDGTAAMFGSGASRPGEFATSLGSTLVIKGISTKLLLDPQGRVYCHRHPQGYWLPGGASNVGGQCLREVFAGEDLAELDRLAAESGNLPPGPTDLRVYPLTGTGERFPFVNPCAEGFVSGSPCSRVALYRAYLEGVAYVERWCYEVIEELSGVETRGTVYSSGGGSRSALWLAIRAAVCGRPFAVPELVDAAFGSAVLAASNTLFTNVGEAARSMVRIRRRVQPDSALVAEFDRRYRAFRTECQKRNLGE